MKTIKLLLNPLDLTYNYKDGVLKRKFKHKGIIYGVVGQNKSYSVIHYKSGGCVVSLLPKMTINEVIEVSKIKLSEMRKINEVNFIETLNKYPIINN